MTGRIIYALAPATGPSGGVRTMLDHVAVLRRSGRDAYAYSAYDSEIPPVYRQDVPLLTGRITANPRDVIVRAEVSSAERIVQSARAGLRQVVFVQNHHQTWASLRGARSYDAVGVTAVMAGSRYIADFLRRSGLAADPMLVPYAVEVPVPEPAPERSLGIAVMPRKRRLEYAMIRQLVPLRFPEFAAVPWIEIDEVGHGESLAMMRTAAVFLALQRFEGFGLPVIEAMASGCLVTGFAGGPGADYATDGNGIWAREDDVEGAVEALGAALRMVRDGAAGPLLEAGGISAAAYDAATRDRCLLAFFEALDRN